MGKVFLNLEKYYFRIWVKWGQNGGNYAKLTKNAVLPSNNGRNATRCQFACLSCTPIINYEYILPNITNVGNI